MNITKVIRKELDKFSHKIIFLSINKMEFLLRMYRKHIYIYDCPLCGIGGCEQCPWLIILDKSCIDIIYDLNLINEKDFSWSLSFIRNQHKQFPRWYAYRLETLPKWIELYKRYYEQRFKKKYKERL